MRIGDLGILPGFSLKFVGPHTHAGSKDGQPGGTGMGRTFEPNKVLAGCFLRHCPSFHLRQADGMRVMDRTVGDGAQGEDCMKSTRMKKWENEARRIKRPSGQSCYLTAWVILNGMFDLFYQTGRLFRIARFTPCVFIHMMFMT